jgi:hypothetical protein
MVGVRQQWLSVGAPCGREADMRETLSTAGNNLTEY